MILCPVLRGRFDFLSFISFLSFLGDNMALFICVVHKLRGIVFPPYFLDCFLHILGIPTDWNRRVGAFFDDVGSLCFVAI